MKLNNNTVQRRAWMLGSLFAVFISALSCSGPKPPPSVGTPAAPPSSQPFASAPTTPTNSGGPPILPDPNLTPGATFDVTKDDVCTPGYSKKVRNVPEEVKREAYREYGILSHQPGEYEVDHLISLELGGSNDLKNLWPESYKTQPWNAHVKDALENELHRLVCSGQLDMRTAQQEIATDWIAAYKKYFHTDMPLAQSHRRSSRSEENYAAPDSPAPADTTNSGSPNEQVWVNTRSGAYWRPGTTYYGKTREGQYMSEADAIRQGYHAAGEPHNR